MMRRWWYVGLGALLAVLVAGGVLYYGTNWARAEHAPEAPKGAMGLLQGGTAHGWLGLSLGQLNSDLASRLGLSRTEGVVVMAVVAGSPAEAAGFQNKDVIISVAGNNVSAPADVVKAVREAAVGSAVQFGVARGNQSLTLTATIAEPPQPGPLKHGLPGIRGFHFGIGRPGRLPELEGVERPNLFDHFLGGQLNFTDRDNRPFAVRIVNGTVAAISDTSITVTPNGGGANVALNITSNTRMHRLQRGGGTPQVGDRVTVTAVGEEARTVAAWPAP